MPSNPEQLLISSILKNGDFKTALAHGISGDMFHVYSDQWLWIESYYARYRRCPARETFAAKNSDFRILRANDTVFFTDEVKKSHARHLLIRLVNDIADDIASGDVDTAIKKAGPEIIAIASGIGVNTDTDIFSDFSDVWDEVKARHTRVAANGSSGIPTGFQSLDDITGGWNNGDLIVLGARLGQGKSWVLQKTAATAAAAGYTTVFDALEQSRSQVAMRIHTLLSAAGESLFRTTSLMQGRDFDLRAYRKFLIRLKKVMPGRLHVSDMSRGKVSPLTVAAQIERHSPDLVIVDYLTLMQKNGPDWQGVAQLSSDMQSLAASYQIPIIVAAQLNRADGAGKGEPPGPEAIAQSDAIGQDAAVLITMRQHTQSTLQMKLAKNRHGPGGDKWWVRFQPGEGVIDEISFADAQDLMDKDKDQEDERADRPRRIRRG